MDLAVDSPSYAHLNPSQKRMFIIRDMLKFLDPEHLDTYLDNLIDSEPPRYRIVNGAVNPPLVEITLKSNASEIDLGNVYFHEPSSGNVVRRVHLFIEDGRCEMKERAAIPEDDDNLYSAPVDVYLIKNTVNMFLDKYKAIVNRCRVLNDLRKCAFGIAKKSKAQIDQINQGKSGKLPVDEFNADEDPTQDIITHKRLPYEPVQKHAMNKRMRIGFGQVPDSVKSYVFGTVPEQTKIELFDTLFQKAMPRFDDLMMACWNVAAVYNGIGSDCTELHSVVSQMIEVLKEFDDSFKMPDKEKEVANDLMQKAMAMATKAREGGGSAAVTSMEGRVPAAVGAAQQHHSQNRGAHGHQDDRNAEDDDNRVKDPRLMGRRHGHPKSKPTQPETSEEQETGRRSLMDQSRDPHPSYPGAGYTHGASMPPWSDLHDPYGAGSYAQEASQYYGYPPPPSQRRYPPYGMAKQQGKFSSPFQKQTSPPGSPKDAHHPSKPSLKKHRRAFPEGSTSEEPREQQEQQEEEGLGDETSKPDQSGKQEKRGRLPATKGIFLGPSKLGPAKKPSNAINRAPIAPMLPGQASAAKMKKGQAPG
ncbi:hypothetical protein P280DRAFT_508714 [Massarina eburnea CBS 473.64]|uniref:Uncharacterized protein n=1 Tax=Massarina eburnea CBS 473.64 TaxID=1395130 RepID=A0A6A6RW91_9PLEO|nr:hypothetical protein P280DRAFT_508714 [Massarina eburnea CBS 473.64]